MRRSGIYRNMVRRSVASQKTLQLMGMKANEYQKLRDVIQDKINAIIAPLQDLAEELDELTSEPDNGMFHPMSQQEFMSIVQPALDAAWNNNLFNNRDDKISPDVGDWYLAIDKWKTYITIDFGKDWAAHKDEWGELADFGVSPEMAAQKRDDTQDMIDSVPKELFIDGFDPDDIMSGKELTPLMDNLGARLDAFVEYVESVIAIRKKDKPVTGDLAYAVADAMDEVGSKTGNKWLDDWMAGADKWREFGEEMDDAETMTIKELKNLLDDTMVRYEQRAVETWFEKYSGKSVPLSRFSAKTLALMGYKSTRWEEIDFGVMIAPMGMNTYAAPHLVVASYGNSDYWAFAKSSDFEKVLESHIEREYSPEMLDELESANHDYVAMDFRESTMKEPMWTNTAMHKVKVPDHEAKDELDFQIGMVAHIQWKKNKLVMPGGWWSDVVRKMSKKERSDMQPVEILLSDLIEDAPDFGWLWFEF